MMYIVYDIEECIGNATAAGGERRRKNNESISVLERSVLGYVNLWVNDLRIPMIKEKNERVGEKIGRVEDVGGEKVDREKETNG